MRTAAAAELSSMVGATESAIIVGREYLRQHPVPSPGSIVQSMVTGGILETRMFGTSNGIRSKQKLRARVRRDFEERRVVYVHGWALSITEAQVCALMAGGQV